MRVLRSPFVMVPAVVVGLYVLSGNAAGGAALAQLTGVTYGTTIGVGVGSIDDVINGFGKGVEATGGASLLSDGKGDGSAEERDGSTPVPGDTNGDGVVNKKDK